MSTPLSRGVRGGVESEWDSSAIRPPGHALHDPSWPPLHAPLNNTPIAPLGHPLGPPRENPLSHHVLCHGEEGGVKGWIVLILQF